MSKKQNVSGILNIDKPKGLTSHDVVAQVRRLSRQRRVGHAGTLDPMATGVLLVCLGQATRLIEYLMQSQKQYRAVIRFGITTNTLDAEGEVTAVRDASGLTEADIRRVLPDFLGQIEQIPPAFSAIKQGGKPLYRLARAGQPVEVPPRQVVIESLEWVDWSPPDLTLDVTCSPGTYIRSLARDLGDALGVGAHLAGLTRTASGSWTLAEAVSLDTLHAAADRSPEGWRQYLQTPDRAVAHLPAVRLDADTARRVRHGQQVDLPAADTDSPELRAYTPTGDFLAILTRVQPGDTLWRPRKVFQ